MVFNLSDQDTLANRFMFELRDRHIQKNPLVFRNNLRRLGSIMAFEISKKMAYSKKKVETPMGMATLNLPMAEPVLVTVLRAGLPFFDGFLDFFDHAECGFIGAYRKEEGEGIQIALEYVAMPSIQGRELVLVDPMLATGKSVVRSVEALLAKGQPTHLYIVSLLAVPEGIKFIEDNLKAPFSLWTVSMDDRLDENHFIIPGLGDAGDLCFGDKI